MHLAVGDWDDSFNGQALIGDDQNVRVVEEAHWLPDCPQPIEQSINVRGGNTPPLIFDVRKGASFIRKGPLFSAYVEWNTIYARWRAHMHPAGVIWVVITT
jgi:hypothetical protein